MKRRLVNWSLVFLGVLIAGCEVKSSPSDSPIQTGINNPSNGFASTNDSDYGRSPAAFLAQPR